MPAMKKISNDGSVKANSGSLSEWPIVADRFKTRMCRTWEHGEKCQYMTRCMFAHGPQELRTAEQNVAAGLVNPAAVRAFQRRQAKLVKAQSEGCCAGGSSCGASCTSPCDGSSTTRSCCGMTFVFENGACVAKPDDAASSVSTVDSQNQQQNQQQHQQQATKTQQDSQGSFPVHHDYDEEIRPRAGATTYSAPPQAPVSYPQPTAPRSTYGAHVIPQQQQQQYSPAPQHDNNYDAAPAPQHYAQPQELPPAPQPQPQYAHGGYAAQPAPQVPPHYAVDSFPHDHPSAYDDRDAYYAPAPQYAPAPPLSYNHHGHYQQQVAPQAQAPQQAHYHHHHAPQHQEAEFPLYHEHHHRAHAEVDAFPPMLPEGYHAPYGAANANANANTDAVRRQTSDTYTSSVSAEPKPAEPCTAASNPGSVCRCIECVRAHFASVKVAGIESVVEGEEEDEPPASVKKTARRVKARRNGHQPSSGTASSSDSEGYVCGNSAGSAQSIGY